MLDKLKMLIMGKQKTVVADAQASFGFGNTMACYKYGSYDNTFPNITRIAESFMTIQPYAVDMRGNKVPNANAIAAIYHPNREMSSVDFFEALMVMALVHPTVYLLCWKREGRNVTAGGNITEKNIAGFTFLESPVVYRNADGSTIYRQGTQEYSDREVIEISLNANPYNLLDGYSPSMAAKKWSNVDDCIADFQTGYFMNGAVPAGQFVVTASSVDEFNSTVDKLQANHRGAGKNNNVVYVHRPTSTIDGKPLNSQIEWVPFAQSNKDMTLQTLFDQANKKIDMDFGVPQEIKGYLQNSNYASANVAERVFDKYVVAPKALKIWTKFTHELNRITGGLGYAISFEYQISALADEDKVVAETRKLQLETLGNALESGFTMDSAIEALDLPSSFRTLALKAPEAQETPEATDGPRNAASQAQTALKSVKVKNVTDDERANWEQIDPKLREVIEDSMNEQIDSAIAGKDYDVKSGAKKFSVALLAVLLGILTDEGEKRYNEATNELRDNGGDVSNLGGYELGEDVRTTYEKYLDEVALSYSEDTAASIKRTLKQGDFEHLSQGKIEENLRNIMQTDEWRLRRLAKTEEHRASMSGDVDAMLQIQKQTGLTVYKVWHLNPASLNHCEVCEAFDGKKIPLEDTFADFAAGDGMVADAHPNCFCYLTFEFEDYKPQITIEGQQLEKTVKVTCPHCGRYMFESTGGNAKNVICANSKCKKHWDIEVADGKISAKENK